MVTLSRDELLLLVEEVENYYDNNDSDYECNNDEDDQENIENDEMWIVIVRNLI